MGYPALYGPLYGPGGYTWAIVAGSLPPGLSLSPGGTITGTPTSPGTFTFTVSVTDKTPTTVTAVLSITITAPVPTVDSLVIADQIELLGGPGGVPSANPACAGAVFKLQPGYDAGAPQPTTDIVGSLILDGERPFGYRASNRTITLPVMIDCQGVNDGSGGFTTLAAAYEVLLAAIDQQTFTLTWTRRQGLPLVLDCFRAQPSVVTWGGADQTLGSPVGAVSLTFQALPYGRSDTPVQIQVASPLPGQVVPQPPVVLDDYSVISGNANSLTGRSAGFDGGIGTWAAGANATVAASSAQAHSGPGSLAMTSVAAGNMNAVSAAAGSVLAQGLPVTAGATVSASAWFTTTGTGRLVNVGVDWYDSTGAFLSTSHAPDVPETVGVWVVATGLLTAPASAALGRLAPQVRGTAAGGEVHYLDDAFLAVTQWQPSPLCVVGPTSANWNPSDAPLSSATGAGSQPGAVYTAALIRPANITGLTALSVWAGFGSGYYSTWHKGPAVFAFTLTDANGTTMAFSRTLTVNASNNPGAPTWQLVTAPIPQGTPGFDYTMVASYTITVTNRGNQTLRYTQLYLDALTANPPSLQSLRGGEPRGAMYSLLGVQGTARAPCSAQFAQPPGSAAPVTVVLPGPVGTPQTWVAPAGVTTVKVECTGPAASGGSYGGAGGGEYAAEAAVAVTPLQPYLYTIGAGGVQSPPGSVGQAASGPTVFTGDTVSVIAHPGLPAATSTTGGLGGTGSSNTTKFPGGNGAAGTAGTSGGGGGGSAGSTGAGGSASGSTGGTAGTGTTPGAAGANGVTSDRQGFPGASPGGGGGGVLDLDNNGGAGGNGQIKVTYTPSAAPFSTLIAHRPGPAAPATLSPLVTFGATDVPNGATEYPLQSLTPGVAAGFGGTYSVAVVANVWATPTTSRTVTIGVKQYEFAGGPAYTTSVARTFKPSTDITNGIVVLGELTLPLKDVAPDNASGLYTITLTDTNTADTFLDALFLDTLGQTVMVNIATAGAYTTFYVDEPSADRDLGRVLGSSFDRGAAISVLDSTFVSGGPLFLTPGDQLWLVYAVEGAPALGITYFPRWFLDRLS